MPFWRREKLMWTNLQKWQPEKILFQMKDSYG